MQYVSEISLEMKQPKIHVFKYPMKCGEFQIAKHLFYSKNLSLSRPFSTCLMEYLTVCLSLSVPSTILQIND